MSVLSSVYIICCCNKCAEYGGCCMKYLKRKCCKICCVNLIRPVYHLEKKKNIDFCSVKKIAEALVSA